MTIPLKRLAECRDDLRRPVNATERAKMQGDIPYWGANQIQDYVDTALVDGQTVLIGEDGAPFFDRNRDVAFYVDEPIWPNNHIHVLKPLPHADPRWLAYALNSVDFSRWISGSTRDKLTQADLMRIELPSYSLGRQSSIADYLDRETATIDALIEKQHDLVSALRDRSLAVRDAVFGPRVGHGERLKWAIQEIDERAGEVRRTWDVLSVSIAWGVSRKSDRGIHQASSEDTSHYKVVRPGDVVINRMRAFQGGLGCSDFEGLTSPDYGVLRVRNLNVDSRWVAAVMKTEIFVGEMVSRLRGIGTVNGSSVRTPRVSLSDICEIRVFVPPLEVQRADVARFEYENAQIDALIAKAERFIELAQERRAALITAAVTGQIEIPTED